MKLCKITCLYILFVLSDFSFGIQQESAINTEVLSSQGKRLPGFSNSIYFDEQVLTFKFNPDVRIQINAPSVSSFDVNKSTEIIFFALPNGNTIEQTSGKILKPGDDWHFDIQHIGAQTRFIRQHDTSYNVVTVYLETSQLSWPSWRSKYYNNAILVKGIVDSVKNIFKNYNQFIVLSGHSGGGGFTFSYLNSVSEIPNEIKRISFLDSDYNYDDSYGAKILNWLNSSSDHFLSVIAYNDSVALYNGKPVVSPTGGTWYRSKMMQKFLSKYFTFTSEEDSNFINYTALNGRIKIILKQNPTRAILHTVQVELNGFIQGIFSGTSFEGQDYVYYGSRAYSSLIQSELPAIKSLTIPPRPSDAISGSAFMKKVWNMNFDQREAEIYNEVSKGNIPDFLRNLIQIKSIFQDASGKTHTVYYQTTPDYLAIGSNDDYCRIPTGPITAQKLANLFGANLTTSKLVDDIHKNSTLRLVPVTYPWSDTSTMVIRFVQHSQAIDSERTAAGGILGELTDGIQKDVVLSNLIIDPTRLNHVVIYGWYKLDGTPIQPLYNGHINSYLDYSHGIRFINNEVLVDSTIMTVPQILKDPVFYKILSNENGPMTQPSYIKPTEIDKSGSQNLPQLFQLFQNYPNPFNPTTTIKYSIPAAQKDSNVSLTVYDILGNKVAELVNEEKPAGNYEIKFDASKLSSGVYFYTLNAGNYSGSKKIILLK
ncbi:MAG: T9SS type A sorting domain-containing protein [Bacteroidetes bacterium]|nr:T9SS type A sorting domain-containing protein [Bacteroidota bacterium]